MSEDHTSPRKDDLQLPPHQARVRGASTVILVMRTHLLARSLSGNEIGANEPTESATALAKAITTGAASLKQLRSFLPLFIYYPLAQINVC